MFILGLNSAYHESSACLVKDGQIVAAVEEERLSRVKHAKPARVDNPDELPVNAIDFCLKQAGIALKDVDWIGYSFQPEIRRKNLEVKEQVVEGDWGSQSGEASFYERLLTIPKKLSQLAGMDMSPKFQWIAHHCCHAASTYFVSPFKESAILSVDGIGEFTTTWFGQGQENHISVIREIEYPNSLGFLWERISEFLGYTAYDAAQIMGLAAYGNPSQFLAQFKAVVTLQNGRFTLNQESLKFRVKAFSELENLFGRKREKGEEITQRHQDIAAALQRCTEEILIELSNSLSEETGSKNLCLAGGVALNCVANSVLLEKSSFENIFVQPVAHDAGTAIGAAFYIWNQMLNKPKNYVLEIPPFWGPEYSEEEIEQVLMENHLGAVYVKNIEEVTAQLVSDGKVVGWFQGKMEMGPRALGNRTILADARNPQVKPLLDQQVKYREWFRPYAPSVLEEKANEWFEIPKPSVSSRFMLFAYQVKGDKRGVIPAVTHVDGTSRVQTVTEQSNPRYYKLLQEFEKLTGVPLILNTSFNTAGEPIVCSPKDAIKTFLDTEMDYLVLGNYLVWKPERRLGKQITEKIKTQHVS